MPSHAAAIDAYYEANLLCGQATEPSLEELTRRALEIKERGDRLYVHWTSPTAEVECQAIGPATRCFCGHSYSSHSWYETGSKQVRCRVDGCRCACFSYVPGRGSTHLRCTCKHEHHDHRRPDGRPGACQRANCSCTGFHSSWRCGSCGEAYDAHTTLFETKRDRAQAGKLSEETLGGWGEEKPHLEAVCGGVTRMSSLLSGVERAGMPLLAHTDGAAPASTAADVPVPLSSTAAIFGNYDRRADAHVARLRRLKESSQSSRFAGGAAGHRLGAPPPPAAALGVGAGHRRGALGRERAPVVSVPAPRPRAPTKAGMRELAAAAAEARAGAGHASADEPQPPEASPLSTREAPAPSTTAASSSHRASAVPGPASHRSAGATARPIVAPPPRGAAKAAVAAARRERAAEAAERRLTASGSEAL